MVWLSAKTGVHRAQYILESVQDLRENLRQLGTDLVVRVGKPEEILFELARTHKTSWIFCNRERTEEEVEVQDALEQGLWSIGQEIRYSRGKMLYYTADLPFPVTHTPDIFTHFRKEVEKFVEVRKPLPTPTKLPVLNPNVDVGKMPTLEELTGFSAAPKSDNFYFKGGETEGLKQLNYYLFETDLAANYKETRNELLGRDYSTKFSPWLAQGCLSPKQIYWELKRYEAEHTKNKSTYWIFFELLWRDFFRLMAKKYGKAIFLREGTKGELDLDLKNDGHLFQIWANARTGIPLIDANMRELKTTGFMSNRGRQNVASFLVKDLKVNWQMGAEWFESLLIDYDVASNWGNWNYIAGVGSDPRENRYFNILKQAKRYDAAGDYVKYWLPELAKVPAEKIHRPDTLSAEEQEQYAVKLGADYPKAMVRMEKVGVEVYINAAISAAKPHKPRLPIKH